MIAASPSDDDLLSLITLTLILVSEGNSVPRELEGDFMRAIEEARDLLRETLKQTPQKRQPEAISLAFRMRQQPELATMVDSIREFSSIDRESAERMLAKLSDVSFSYG